MADKVFSGINRLVGFSESLRRQDPAVYQSLAYQVGTRDDGTLTPSQLTITARLKHRSNSTPSTMVVMSIRRGGTPI